MTALIAVISILIAIFFVWRVFKVASRLKPIEEPPEEVGDINVREPVPRRPRGRADAIAMEEPEDDIDTDAYSRK